MGEEEREINYSAWPENDTAVIRWGMLPKLPEETEKMHQGTPACHYAEPVTVFPGLPQVAKDKYGNDVTTMQHDLWIVENSQNFFIGKSGTTYYAYNHIPQTEFFATEPEAMKVAQQFHKKTGCDADACFWKDKK